MRSLGCVGGREESGMNAPKLSRLALEGVIAALIHAETMMTPDPETYGPEDWKRQEAAQRWAEAICRRRGLKWERPQ